METKIRGILNQDFNVPEEKLTPEATFRGTMALDSLDVVDFIMLIHKDLGFEAELKSYRDLNTFGDLLEFVERHLGLDAG